MTLFKALFNEADSQNVKIYETTMKSKIKGLYADNIICLNRRLPSTADKICVLAEEMGHYYTSTGNIIDLNDVRNRKQEKRARNWAYEKLIPLQSFVEAAKEGVRNRYELAEFLGVTEEFLGETIEHYKEKYGLHVRWASYLIYFDPLGVVDLFDD